MAVVKRMWVVMKPNVSGKRSAHMTERTVTAIAGHDMLRVNVERGYSVGNGKCQETCHVEEICEFMVPLYKNSSL